MNAKKIDLIEQVTKLEGSEKDILDAVKIILGLTDEELESEAGTKASCPPHAWNFSKVPISCAKCGVYYPG